MRKIISIILAALMITGALSLCAAAAQNSNHYVEPDSPILAEDDS